MITIAAAGAGTDFDAAREIFREYAGSLAAGHVCLSAFEKELAGLEFWYASILLAHDGPALAGAVAMRGLRDGACEMKRLYVRVPWRGSGLGRQLVSRVIQSAASQGYRSIRLDTMPEMAAAIELYKSFGFQQIPPYGENPSGAICLELQL